MPATVTTTRRQRLKFRRQKLAEKGGAPAGRRHPLPGKLLAQRNLK